MRKSKFILGSGLLAMLSLTACSNDDPVAGGEEALINGNVYVAVRIHDASSLNSRGSVPANPASPYEDATAYESDVTTADFYFYDENGIFVAQANVWGGKETEGTDNSNIQFNSNNVVVLKDLKNAAHPDYVVTVLNQPMGFTVEPGSSLADMEEALSIASYSNGFMNENGKFVMATTSFVDGHTCTSPCKHYFATKLVPANFTQSYPNEQPLSPAEIYVERLACRLNLAFTTGNGANDIKYDDASKSYVKKLSVTVAGGLNADDKANPNLTGAEDVYVHIYGWSLNATAKNSRMVKTIDPTWANDAFTGFTWNVSGDHRSFWGKSFNYDADNAEYPGHDYDGEYDATNTSSTKHHWNAPWIPDGADGYPLNYISYDNIYDYENQGKEYSLYCPENTNTSTVVSAHGSAITSVVLKAKVTGSDGVGLNLVRYRGVLYTQTNYLKYMINLLKSDGHLNYYTCTNPTAAPADRVYEQIGTDKIKLVDSGDGEVVLVPNFVISGTDAIEVYKYDDVDDDFDLIDATDYANLQGYLTALNAQVGYQANGYKGGMMYYNIPIEHLATNTSTVSGNVSEAVYGVVRNHSYVITVNQIANLGQGVFEPDKKIIIDTPTPDQKLWSVGASIKILSWKIVNQSVNL